MSRMAFLTFVLARSQVVPPSRSRGGRRAAAVLLDQIEPLDGNEELVVAVVAQLQELLDVVADRNLLEADELADAVVHVHDEVADLQIAQVGQERGGRGSLAERVAVRAGALPRRRRRGIDRQPGARQAEAARELAVGHERGAGRLVVGVPRPGRPHVVVAEELHRALGAAARPGDEEHRVVARERLPDVGHPVGDAALELLRRLIGDLQAVTLRLVDAQLLQCRCPREQRRRSVHEGAVSREAAAPPRPCLRHAPRTMPRTWANACSTCACTSSGSVTTICGLRPR